MRKSAQNPFETIRIHPCVKKSQTASARTATLGCHSSPLVHRLAFLLILLGVASSSLVKAATVGETVEEHLDTELEKAKKNSAKSKSKKTSQTRSEAKNSGKNKAKKKEKSTRRKKNRKREAIKDQQRKKGEKLDLLSGRQTAAIAQRDGYPRRLIGKNFVIDPQAGFGYRGWRADQYPAVRIKTTSYPQWYVGFQGRLFERVRIYRAFYESSGFKSPRKTGAVIAASATRPATNAASKLLGMMGYDFQLLFIPMVRYEVRSFEATAEPLQALRVIPFTASQNDDLNQFPLSEESLSAVSTFETLVVGLHYNDRLKNKAGEILPPKILPFYVGGGVIQYRKPYQVRVGSGVLDELIFNSRFRGAGLAAGFDLAGGIRRLGLSLSAQLGLGEIKLLQDLTLNEVLPSEWLIGYFQGELKADYTFVISKTKPTLLFSPSGSVGGMSFFFINTGGEEADTPLANWDLLWTGMGRLIIPL